MRGLSIVVAVVLLATACSSSDDKQDAEPASDATVTVDTDAFLTNATKTFSPGDALNAIAFFERAARDPNFDFAADELTPEAFEPVLEKIDDFEDTTDFDVLYILNLWYAHGKQLPTETQDAIAKRLKAFKYWYTEPTPDGVVDNKYYWSENHRIIFHVDEYLAGLAFPDATFTNDGRTGQAHADTAKQRILEWLDEKVRFGFSEWHSDVYYQKNLTPLLSLVEFAPDPDLANRAAMLLDLVLLDIALHMHRGNFGATHGRSYMKDKSTATDQNTFDITKMLFDDTTEPYNEGAGAAVLFARAKKWTLPRVIRAIATDPNEMIDTEHMNVPLDPLAPVTANPEPPFGIAFDDPETVTFWWERGAQTAWQTVEQTIKTLDEHELWDSQFYKDFKPLRDLVGDDPDQARTLAQSLAAVLGFGLLSEVNTYTYRTDDVMLSTAQDYRPGVFVEQVHAWQATLAERAIVFSTHPKNEPQEGTEWPDSDGYWTGSGSMPRSAQHENVSISIYNPQFDKPGPPLERFGYLDYTHAYFPTEHFDEVVRDEHWTFGRKGDGFVALYSGLMPEWREHDPDVVFTHGLTKPFDLVAPGSAQNVWITEVGDTTTYKDFADFQAKIAAAPVAVAADQRVSYTSPAQGAITFGWNDDLTVAGQPVDLHPPARMANPFVTVPFEGRQYDIRHGDQQLVLDFDAWQRRS